MFHQSTVVPEEASVNDTAQIIFGLCGLAGGTAGLVGAFLVWRVSRQDRSTECS
jgi:hypothetical protein